MITTIIDTVGEQLATYPEDLTQIEVGQPDFYIGQTNYSVRLVEVVGEERIVTVERR